MKIQAYAASDPDVQIDDFMLWYNQRTETKRREKIDSGMNITVFSLGDRGDLRKIDLPTSPVQSEKAKNNPWTTQPSEQVYNSDTIPYETYRKMDSDSTIAIGKKLLVGLIASLGFKVSCDDEKVQQVVTEIYKRHHNHILRNIIMTSMRDGFCFGEKIWKRRRIVVFKDKADGAAEEVYNEEAVDLLKVKFLDPTNRFRFYIGDDDEIRHIIQSQSKGDVKVKRSKLVWFALDREYSNVFGRSRYKNSYLDWYLGKIASQYMFKHLERKGSPHLEGRYPVGRQMDDDGNLISNDVIMRQMGEHLMSFGSVTMPSTRDDHGEYVWSLTFAEGADAKIDHYLDVLNHHKAEKLNGLGIFSSIAMDSANFSEVDAKADIQLLMLESDIDQIQEVIAKDIIAQIVSYNFGPEMVDRVHFKIDRAAFGKKKILKEIMSNVVRLMMSRPDERPKMLPDVSQGLGELGIDMLPYDDLMEEDAQKIAREEKKEERKAEVAKANAEQAAAAAGQTPEQKQVRNEKSNSTQRATPDTRDRGRKTKDQNVA